MKTLLSLVNWLIKIRFLSIWGTCNSVLREKFLWVEGREAKLVWWIVRPWPFPTLIYSDPVYSSACKFRLLKSLVKWFVAPVSWYQKGSGECWGALTYAGYAAGAVCSAWYEWSKRWWHWFAVWPGLRHTWQMLRVLEFEEELNDPWPQPLPRPRLEFPLKDRWFLIGVDEFLCARFTEATDKSTTIVCCKMRCSCESKSP